MACIYSENDYYRATPDLMVLNPKCSTERSTESMTRIATPKKVRFNKASIDALKPPAPPADRRYVYDDTTPTLCICVTATGKKTFYRYGRINGEPTREKLGRWPTMTIEQARKAVARLNGQIADGRNPATERRTVRAAMTLAELWDYYLENHARPRKKSCHQDEWLWKKLVEPQFSHRKLNEIRRGEIKDFHATLGRNSIYNANRVRSLLLTMYNVAADAGYEGENPVARLKPFKEVKRERVFTADEVVRLFAALDAESNQTVADAIRFGLWTGARRGNWLSVRWDEINLKQKVWTIPAKKAKSSKPIVVPLNEQAVKILKGRVVASEWVFPSRYDGIGHVTSPKSVWKTARTAANLTDARMHDLRRTLATFAVNAGVPLFQVAKLLGHQTTAVTEAVYARSQDEALRAAAEAAGAAIMAATRPAPVKPKRKARPAKRKSE
jgi:integrase